jgi:hypothetical protein
VHSVNQADLSNSKDHLKIPHKAERLSSYLDMDKKMKTRPNYWVLKLQTPDNSSHMETHWAYTSGIDKAIKDPTAWEAHKVGDPFKQTKH